MPILKSIFIFLILKYIILTSSPLFANQIKVTSDKSSVTCLQDPTNSESSNSFLIDGKQEFVLIDAGWNKNLIIPAKLFKKINSAKKVTTHFHWDHLSRWSDFNKINLSKKQSTYCKNEICKPSLFKSIFSVNPFKIDAVYDNTTSIGSGLDFFQCEGHSETDACFIHLPSRTIFLGDIFYPGNVFAFLPGGSTTKIRTTIEKVLSDDRWERIAISHGECFTNREEMEKFAKDIGVISEGGGKWQWNFYFWIPLRMFKISTGSVIVGIFDR